MKIFSKNQSGSVYLMVIFGMGVIIVLMVMGIITINTNQVVSSIPAERLKYIQDVQNTISSWYRSNSMDPRLFDPSTTLSGCASGGICDNTANVFISEAGVQNKYNIRFFVSDVFQTYGSAIPDPASQRFHKNVMFRRIYFAIGDTDVEPVDAIEWNPSESGMIDWDNLSVSTAITPTFRIKSEYEGRVTFGYVDGKKIQDEQIAVTYDVLLNFARLQEARYKAKFESDSFHDIGQNYFRGQDCYNLLVSGEEIPCTDVLAVSNSTRTDITGSLGSMRSLSFHELFEPASGSTNLYSALLRSLGAGFPSSDAWGNPILMSNSAASGASLNTPYSMVVASVTPWGTWLIVNGIQPVN